MQKDKTTRLNNLENIERKKKMKLMYMLYEGLASEARDFIDSYEVEAFNTLPEATLTMHERIQDFEEWAKKKPPRDDNFYKISFVVHRYVCEEGDDPKDVEDANARLISKGKGINGETIDPYWLDYTESRTQRDIFNENEEEKQKRRKHE